MKKLKNKLLLIVLMSTAPIPIFAHDIELENSDGVTIYYKKLNYRPELAVSCRGNWASDYKNEYKGTVKIPEKVTYAGTTYSVTSICANAFYGCSSLTSVEIPNSVTSIGDAAFSDCSGLKKVIVPDIAAWCNIQFSSNPLYYAKHLYCDEATEITDLAIPEGVTSIGGSAFSGCSGLTSIEIPNSVTSIGGSAFSGCSGLTSIEIPNSVTSIGNKAFEGTAWYNNQPYGLVYAGKVAYKYKGNMPNNASIVLKDGTTGIGSYAFSDCSNLTSIMIPNSVTNIGSYAFSGCRNLASIMIPNSVTNIGSYAFSGCSNLTSIMIPNSVTNIGDNTLEETAWYNNQPDGLIYAGKVAYRYKGNMPNNTSIVLKDGTTAIGSYAFFGCSNLASIMIPNSVTNIGSCAFFGCSNLASIMIPNSVTNIGRSALMGCRGLSSISIPNSVTSIGLFAFSGCTLQELTLSSSVTNIESTPYGGGESPFTNCYIKSLLILSTDWNKKETNKTFYGLDTSSVIYAYSYSIPDIQNSFKGKVFAIDVADYNISVAKNYYKGVDLMLTTDSHRTIKSARVEVDGKEVASPKEGLYEVRGLKSGTAYSIIVDAQTSMTINGKEFTANGKITRNWTTQTLGFSQCSYTASQTGLTINQINAETDQTATVKEVGFSLDGKQYIVGSNPVMLSNLSPNTDYPLELYAIYSDGETIYETFSCRTASLLPFITMSELTPTTFKCTGSYMAKDAIIIGSEFVGYNTGNTLHLRDLIPNKTYSIKYKITTENGGSETKSFSFTTPTPTFKSLPARTVKAGEVIVAAETNLVDEVVSVGFEWRKTSAPSDLPSSIGAGAIYKGKLEAIIKNLTSISGVYYRVRPYYEYVNGNKIYGDWIAFDPTEVSYSEPVIHTYDNPEIENNSAKLIGYVIPGSDEIIEQGFEYWSTGVANAKSMGNSTSENTQKIVANGQRMTATIDNLLAGTTYSYRAYLTTAKGTKYGEEQTFTTSAVDGIVDVEAEQLKHDNSTSTGVYTLSGLKVCDDVANLKTLSRGIYIVNGKKVVVK